MNDNAEAEKLSEKMNNCRPEKQSLQSNCEILRENFQPRTVPFKVQQNNLICYPLINPNPNTLNCSKKEKNPTVMMMA